MYLILFNNVFYIVDNKAKGRTSKRGFQENIARQIFQKRNISYPLIRTPTGAYQGARNVPFSENLACFVFLKHLFWDSPFCLITDAMKLLIASILQYGQLLRRSDNCSLSFSFCYFYFLSSLLLLFLLNHMVMQKRYARLINFV